MIESAECEPPLLRALLYDRNGQSCTFIIPRRLATARPSVAGEAARHAGAADASGPPEGVRGNCAAPGGPLPDLFCDEIMPKTTSWPPEHKPWPFQAPPPPPPPDRGPPTVAAVSPLPSSRDPTRVVGTPVRVDRVSRHARPCRMSELEKLAARIGKLERTLCELSERIDASSRKRHSQPVNQPGCGAVSYTHLTLPTILLV